MKDKEFREKLERLQMMIDEHDAEVITNPLPFLNDMEKRCCELLRVFDEIEYALSPGVVYEVATEMKIEPIDFQGEALVRCDKALEVIYKFKNGRNPSNDLNQGRVGN